MPTSRAYGNNAWIGIAEEITYGTPVTTSTDFIEILSESVKLTKDLKTIPTLRTRSAQYYVEGKTSVGGSVETPLAYTGLEKFFKHGMGTVVDSIINADGQYTHTYSLAEALPTGLTMQINRDAAKFGNNFLYAGMLCKKIKISQGLAGEAKASFDFLGCAETLGTVGTPSFPVAKLPKWTQLSTLTLNSVAVPCRSVEWSIENAMAEDVYVMGNTARQELKANGERVISGSVEAYLDGAVQYALFTARTEFAIALGWVGETIAGASKYEFSIAMPKCVSLGDTPNVGGPGPILMKIPFRAIISATANDECSVVIKNIKAIT